MHKRWVSDTIQKPKFLPGFCCHNTVAICLEVFLVMLSTSRKILNLLSLFQLRTQQCWNARLGFPMFIDSHALLPRHIAAQVYAIYS